MARLSELLTRVPDDVKAFRIARRVRHEDWPGALAALDKWEAHLRNTEVMRKYRWARAVRKHVLAKAEPEAAASNGSVNVNGGLDWDQIGDRCRELAPRVLSRMPERTDQQRKYALANKVGREYGIPLLTGDPDRKRLFAIAASSLEEEEL